MNFLRKCWRSVKHFVVTTAKAFVRKTTDIFKGTWENLEGVVLLILSAYGLTALISELPFYVVMPAFIEGFMVIPVLSVLLVSSLLWFMVWSQEPAGVLNAS